MNSCVHPQNNCFHFGLKKGAEEKNSAHSGQKTVDIGIHIVYWLMKKQLLVVETVPGKTLGFQSLSKMFCIVAIAAAVALSPESTGPLAPSAAQAQTAGDCGCTLQWVNPQDYGDDTCGYQLSKDLAAADYRYCLEQCKIERDYRDDIAVLDWIEDIFDSINYPEDGELGDRIDSIRENVENLRGVRLRAAYYRWGVATSDAYQRNQECLDWED